VRTTSWPRVDRNVEPHELHGRPRPGQGPLGIFAAVELRRRQILGSVERQLSVAPKVLGDAREPLDVVLAQGVREPFALCEQDARDVVDPRGRDSAGPQERLEGQLDDFLRLPHDIGPALPIEEHIERPQPHRGAPNVVRGESLVLHQAALAQYGCPWAVRRTIFPSAIMPRIEIRRVDTVRPRSNTTIPSTATSAQVPMSSCSRSGR